MGKNLGRRIASIFLTATMASTFIAGQALAFSKKSSIAASADEYSLNFESANGKYDFSDIKLSQLNKDVRLNDQPSTELKNTTRTVIVTLDSDVETSRTEIGATEKKAMERRQEKFLSDLKKAEIRYSLVSRYYSIFNGVAIDVKLSELTKIKEIDGVKTVTVGSTYERPKTIETFEGATKNFSSIYPSGIYDSSEYLDKVNGKGMTVAVLDTGLDYTHEAFAETHMEDRSELGYTFEDITNLMSETEFKATIRSGATARDVHVSDKVPFAYDYADNDADVYPSYSQHGTHVAGIVAGKCDSYTNKDGYIALDDEGHEIPFRGVAPEAQLVICKVFTDNLESDSIGGAEAVNILDALEDCYNLNVDVVNMSLGSSCGFSSKALGLTDEDEEGNLMKTVYTKLRNKGITMMVAASNDYSSGYGGTFGTNLAKDPDSATVGSPSTYLGSMSVASVNGQLANYMLANPTVNGDVITGGDAVYYEESRNEDSDAYNFLNEILGENPADPGYKTKGVIKYVAVDGNGQAGDYTANIKRELADKAGYDAVVVLVKRGITSFKDKIEVAKDNGADGVIVYNNVSGMIRMSLGDLDDPIPSVSVSMEIGLKLRKSINSNKTGVIYLDRSYLAGPFMNEYSSWGPSPDLKLKPDITSHGGEITSTVAGGFDEMSGTSMACPNLAGFTALLKSYLKTDLTKLWQGGDHEQYALTSLANNMMMSTATVVYDQNGLPYSPRKQGAGLATLKNVFSTKAYLYTKDTYNYSTGTYNTSDPEYMCEDGRPKAELGDDPTLTGKYDMVFRVKNFGDVEQSFTTNSIVMTETLGADGKSIAEKAHVFGNNATWKVDGKSVAEGGSFTVPAGGDVKVEVTVQLSANDKAYMKENFTDPLTGKFIGMYIEGFLQLKGDGEQCDLNFPFLAYYGDWHSSRMLDLDRFTVAQDDMDLSKKDEERVKASVFATQPYATYWNEKYVLPLGSFVYNQNEALEHTADYVYPQMEHIAISRYNEFYGENSTDNYMTSTGFKALYAGLLRNAEVVTYRLTSVETGETILEKEVYRVSKAYANGGSNIPANVQLDLRTYELGLSGNGKYRMDFDFYADYEDYKNGEITNDTFEFTFYVDYEAPILVDSRIRFQDRKDENNKDIQKVYLDLDIFDNHYPQAVILSYLPEGGNYLKLATEYITPIINPLRNTTNTVSLDITDLYEDYKGNLYVELDDYALNNNVYMIDLAYSKQTAVCPSDFEITLNGQVVSEITVPVNTAVKLDVKNSVGANATNFNWDLQSPYAEVKNGEVFGKRVTNANAPAILTVSGGQDANGTTGIKQVKVHVVESDATLGRPTIEFGTMINADGAIVAARGLVRVNSEQEFKLQVNTNPWYYPVGNLGIEWSSSDDTLATVDQQGNIKILYEGDKTKNVTITATATAEGMSGISTSVILSIRDPYTIGGGILTKYQGLGGELQDHVLIGGQYYDNVRVLKIPNDRAITQIASDAFKDNLNVEVVIIPKNVSTISERAFIGCTNLKKVCFIDEEKILPADSSLFMIERYAFQDCTSLVTVDLSNCKVITLDLYVFAGCTALKEVVDMPKIGTMGAMTFMGCTSLEKVDLSKLHVAGAYVFAGCTGIKEVITSKETAFGEYMFMGCTSLKNVEINCPYIPMGVFNGCYGLNSVTLNTDVTEIGYYAFYNCYSLNNFNLNGHTVGYLGDQAFYGCAEMNNLYDQENFMPELGYDVFNGVNSISDAKKKDGVLYAAPKTISSTGELTTLLNGVTEIAPYAFSGTTLGENVTSFDLTNIKKIGIGAFYGLTGLKSVTLPNDIKEIAHTAFYGTSLETVTIPASVEVIGKYAFAANKKLANIQFEGNNLVEIQANAFDGCGFTEITVPATVKTIGSEAFASNKNLVTANISAVTSMGKGVFAFCPALTTATFADGATDAGTFTFFGGAEGTVRYRSYDVENYYAYGEDDGKLITFTASALTSVTLSNQITQIKEGVFAMCESLVSIDLKNVTEIYDERTHSDKYTAEDGYIYSKGTELLGSAFYANTSLTTVTGLKNVKTIGPRTFALCSVLTTANLQSAESVGYSAFFNCVKLTSLTLGNSLEGIGDEAFAETGIQNVTIPASCAYVGASAFSGGAGMKAYAVDKKSEYFFADEQGVLYAYTTLGKDFYKLMAYPARSISQNRTYTVLEGTITIADYAFFLVPSTSVSKVILPYTLKSIGNGAFFMCEITTYRFESIVAPTLLEGMSPRIIEKGYFSCNSYYYNNFVGYLINYSTQMPGDTSYEKSPLTIEYPTNGTGYDNFVYSKYFGTKVLTGEAIEDNTRTFNDIIDSLPDASTLSGLSKDEIIAIHAQVKEAHGLYNGFANSQAQVNETGNRVSKMLALEDALRPLKSKYNIKVSISNVGVDASSTHKTNYVEGERFSLKGLKLLVTYDDHSQEVIDASGSFEIEARLNRALKLTDASVKLEGKGAFEGETVRVSITVTEGKGSGSEGAGDGTKIAIIIVAGVVALFAVAAVVCLLVLKKKGVIKGKDVKTTSEEGQAEDDATAADDATETEEADVEATETEEATEENNSEDAE